MGTVVLVEGAAVPVGGSSPFHRLREPGRRRSAAPVVAGSPWAAPTRSPGQGPTAGGVGLLPTELAQRGSVRVDVRLGVHLGADRQRSLESVRVGRLAGHQNVL